VCAGGEWDEEERWDEWMTIRMKREKGGHREREGAKRKRVRKEAPPRGGSCAGASVGSVNEVVG